MRGFANLILQSEVEDVVGEVRPHQKFGGEIVDGADVVPDVVLFGGEPTGEDAVAHGVGEGHEVVFVGRGFGPLAYYVEEIFENRSFEDGDGGAGAFVVGDKDVSVGDWFLHARPRRWVRLALVEGS